MHSPASRLLQFLPIFALFCTSQVTQAEDWARFRGPDGSGITKSTAPTKWTESENLTWKVKLPGPGSSSPIVVGDQIFVTCYSGYADDSQGTLADLRRHLVCVDRNSGEIQWKTEVNGEAREDRYEGFITEHGYASNTPVSDGKRVYCYFGKAGAIAYDLKGKELWRKVLGTDSGSKR